MVQVGDAAIAAERRERHDRRRTTWRTFVQGSLTPRRRNHRRTGEGEMLVDWHEPHLLFLAIMILLLSVVDALLTLNLMHLGAEEANPVMAFLINDKPRIFALVKMSLTGAGIVVLVALARARFFRIIRISIIMHWCLLAYVGLIAYEAWMLQTVF
jgi:hypothetical protein